MEFILKTCEDITFYEAKPDSTDGGPPYLLLHGLGNSLNFWVAVAPHLGQYAHTVAIDIPGFGRSPLRFRDFNIEIVTDKILSFYQKLGVEKGILVAHSLGAIVAIRLAAKAPNMFSRLILVDGTLGRATHLVQRPLSSFKDPRLAVAVAAQFVGGLFSLRRRAATLIGGSKLMRQLLLWPYVAEPRSLDVDLIIKALSHNGGLAVVKVAMEARRVNYEALVKAVPHAIDLIWGEGDRLINGTDVDSVKALANVERELTLRTCGHWPMVEKPEELTRFILSWRDHGAV
jgi:pimeloyl-ACP methyl ester carboxylesterase